MNISRKYYEQFYGSGFLRRKSYKCVCVCIYVCMCVGGGGVVKPVFQDYICWRNYQFRDEIVGFDL